MRVLVIPLGLASHYYPIAPLAWAFRTAGHDVRVACQAPAVKAVIESGMPVVHVGSAYEPFADLARADELILKHTGKTLAEFDEYSSIPSDVLRQHFEIRGLAHVKTAETMADDLVPFVEAWRPDLVIADPITLSGPLVAQVVKSPLVLHAWGTQVPPAKVPAFGAFVESLRGGLGKIYSKYAVEFTQGSPPPMVVPCPPSLGFQPPHGIPARYVPYNGSGSEPSWLHETQEKPRICISWSLSWRHSSDTANNPLATLVKGLSELDVELIVTTGANIDVGVEPIPGKLRVTQLLPLNVVLPTCALAISNGGSGSVLTAASLGVPQAIFPLQQEQLINARNLAATGAGKYFSISELNDSRVFDSIHSQLTDGSVRESATRLRKENDSLPSPTVTVQNIQRLFEGQGLS